MSQNQCPVQKNRWPACPPCGPRLRSPGLDVNRDYIPGAGRVLPKRGLLPEGLSIQVSRAAQIRRYQQPSGRDAAPCKPSPRTRDKRVGP